MPLTGGEPTGGTRCNFEVTQVLKLERLLCLQDWWCEAGQEFEF